MSEQPPRPVPTCAGTQDGPYRVVRLERTFPDGGLVGITARYTWDGVSSYPACDGDVHDVHVYNTSTTKDGYVKLPNRRRGNKWIDIPPGTDVTISGGQLNSYGVETAADLNNIGLSSNPDALVAP